MPRLIDADEFKKENARLLHCDFPYLAEDTLEELIDDAPTVDAVEVVRCKDCKYWEYDVIFSDGWCRGKHQGNPSWFCADGERREDAR